MSCHARHPRSLAHRWCTPLTYAAVLLGLLPALFGGATAVMLVTLAAFAGLGLLMVTAAMLGGRNPRRARQPHSSAARLTDTLIILVGSGLLIGALAGNGSTPPAVTSTAGSSLVWVLLALCVVHHIVHRRTRRRSRRY